MTDKSLGERLMGARTQLIGAALVIAGFWLTSVSWWFFLLVGLGTFGPGVLREFGWLRDKDEFQRGADHRAGYHAFLVAGLAAFVLVAFFRSGERALEHTERLATLFLSLLWFTWFLSSMLAFWGSQRAAAWILRVFGGVLLVFTIASNLGSEWTGWAALLLHPLLALPFFVLAGTSRRWPRLSGLLLLAVAAGFTVLLGGPVGDRSEFPDVVAFVFILGPLLAGGVALLFAEKPSAGPDDFKTRIEAAMRGS